MAFQAKFLAGKVALVTGASRGIGRAIALRLAQAGAHIAIHYVRKKKAAHEIMTEIKGMGQESITLKANLAQADQTEAMLETFISHFGQCDIFVANAASGVPKSVMEMTDKHWDWTLDINARSILHCSQRLVPFMEQAGKGHIVTLTSPGSRRTLPYYAPIGLSKAMVEALTRYLAVELAPKGITVNAVSPGVVETDALSSFPIDLPLYLDFALSQTPAGRLTTPQDVADVVAFLCSPSASMIVGQTITVDGGYSTVMWQKQQEND